jgi:hypothetical protein
MMETFALFAFQTAWEMLLVFSVMAYPVMFIVATVVIIALLRMMKAQQRMADSMERIEGIMKPDKGGAERVTPPAAA